MPSSSPAICFERHRFTQYRLSARLSVFVSCRGLKNQNRRLRLSAGIANAYGSFHVGVEHGQSAGQKPRGRIVPAGLGG